MNESISIEAVCRTAPATPGLLIQVIHYKGEGGHSDAAIGHHLKTKMCFVEKPKICINRHKWPHFFCLRELNFLDGLEVKFCPIFTFLSPWQLYQKLRSIFFFFNNFPLTKGYNHANMKFSLIPFTHYQAPLFPQRPLLLLIFSLSQFFFLYLFSKLQLKCFKVKATLKTISQQQLKKTI